MNTFDEQTDFSFVAIAEQKCPEVSKPRNRNTGHPVQIGKQSVQVKVVVPNMGKWNKGLKHSAEHRAKLRTTRLGKKLTGQALENVRLGHLKRDTTFSKEHRSKLSLAAKSRPSNKPNSKTVVTPKGIFNSAVEAAEFYGCSAGVMRSLIARFDERGVGFYYLANGGKVSKDNPRTYKTDYKEIMTPAGILYSIEEVLDFFNIAETTLRAWLKKYSQHFYYIEETV